MKTTKIHRTERANPYEIHYITDEKGNILKLSVVFGVVWENLQKCTKAAQGAIELFNEAGKVIETKTRKIKFNGEIKGEATSNCGFQFTTTAEIQSSDIWVKYDNRRNEWFTNDPAYCDHNGHLKYMSGKPTEDILNEIKSSNGGTKCKFHYEEFTSEVPDDSIPSWMYEY